MLECHNGGGDTEDFTNLKVVFCEFLIFIQMIGLADVSRDFQAKVLMTFKKDT